MEKYRLKQWYPSLGSDFEVKDIVYFDRIRGCYVSTNNRDIVLRKREVENNPDFWELIEEEKPGPLFVTDDGVEVFIGDSYIIVEEDFKKHRLIAHNLPYTQDFKKFKHESNADEYIWRNKKVFSYEDFIRWGNVPYERVIMQLAKERVEG